MILFLLIFLPLLVLIGAAGYYAQLVVIQQERIARQGEQIKRQAEEIATLRQALATSEAQRTDLIAQIQRGAEVVRGQDCQIAQLRGWITMDMQTWRRN